MTKNRRSGEGLLAALIIGYRHSGRSLVLQRLEQAGYACVDNLPARLVPDYLEHARKAGDRVAVAVDTEAEGVASDLKAFAESISSRGGRPALVFIEATDAVLRDRQEAGGEPPGEDWTERLAAIRAELSPVRAMADLILDSSYASPLELRDRIIALLEGGKRAADTVVDIGSFGFTRGTPEGDLVVDVRFIPNPYYVSELRPLTGKDRACSDYVFGHESARGTLDALVALARSMLPAIADQGKATLRIRIGCTGGRHRSVAMAEALAAALARLGMKTSLRHREIESDDRES